MLKLIKTEVDEIIKKYSKLRKTIITNAETVDVDLDLVEEKDVVVVFNKFNYIKMLDYSVFEKNKESIEDENEYIITCKNTDNILVFTDNGNMHQIKCEKIPLLKIKDKGVPIDNISNFESSIENIVFVESKSNILASELLFITKNGLVKIVSGVEFDVGRKTISSTKLNAGDQVAFILSPIYNHLVLQTKDNTFIRFEASSIPEMKKTSAGVKGIKLKDDDSIVGAYMLKNKENIDIKVGSKNISSLKIKLTDRGIVGKKIKI
jgi:DNA gyrase subunit A